MLICIFECDKIITIIFISNCFFIMFNHHSYLSSDFITDFRRFTVENYNNIELIMSKLLLSMNFSLQLKGSAYLKDAVEYCFLQTRDIKISLSGEVYPYIASKRNVKVRNVERDLRNAIQNCFYNGNILILNDICGYEIISDQYPPTVSEFVSKVTEVIRITNQTYCEKTK